MPLTPPAAGQPVSASLIAEIIRELRAQRVLPGIGTSVRRTPNGTHVSAGVSLPTVQPKAADHSCFRLETRTELELGMKEAGQGGADDEWMCLVDCYANIGGVTLCYSTKALWKVDDEDEEEEDEEEEEKVVLYLETDDGKVEYGGVTEEPNVGSCQLEEFLEKQKDTSRYLTPLYVMKKKKVVTDLRCAPQIQLVEILKASADSDE